MAEQISAELARELIRDRNTYRLNTDPHAVDKLNQSVIEEFRANQGQGRVGGPLEKWPILLLTISIARITQRPHQRPPRFSSDHRE